MAVSTTLSAKRFVNFKMKSGGPMLKLKQASHTLLSLLKKKKMHWKSLSPSMKVVRKSLPSSKVYLTKCANVLWDSQTV